MKKSRKQINKIVLRFFAFVSIISVTLCGFSVGGNAVSFEAPSVNVTSAVSILKTQYPYVEFKNTSVRYNTNCGYYNTVLVLLPKTRSGINFFLDNSGTDSASAKMVFAGFSTEFTQGLEDSIFYVAYANNLLSSSFNLTGDSGTIGFRFATICLYYANDSYYSNSSIDNFKIANINSSVYNTFNYSFSRNEFNNYINGRTTVFHNSNLFPANFSGGGITAMYQMPNLTYIQPVGANVNATNISGDSFTLSRVTFMLGESWQYVWSGASVEYELLGDSEPLVVDFSHTGCTDGSSNVCDCDCGYYTEQLKQDLIDYFDTNYITKAMFLQYATGVNQLASSYSSLAQSYSVQASQQSALARDFSSLADAYSVLASQNGANNSLLEEQNDILSSRYAEENSRASEEQSNLDSLASGTTSPDTDISGGVAELSSKFDIYFNQIESFRNNLSTVPVEVSQAGVMVTNITNKLPNSIKVAIIFVLVILVVSKVIGR